VRANRVILAVGGVLAALLLLGAGAVVQVLRSAGWSPGASTVHVLGSSMAPTILDGDYLVVQPYAAGSAPRPGDIVEMRDPYDASRSFIKRVVAVPGQTLLIRGAQVIVDGQPLSEPYVSPEPWTASGDWPPDGSAVTLGPDEFFVLGDNRNHSSDSRVFGTVRRAGITGRAVGILVPRTRAHRL
jgi:signal peptidase I